MAKMATDTKPDIMTWPKYRSFLVSIQSSNYEIVYKQLSGTTLASDWAGSFFIAHQHISGHLVLHEWWKGSSKNMKDAYSHTRCRVVVLQVCVTPDNCWYPLATQPVTSNPLYYLHIIIADSKDNRFRRPTTELLRNDINQSTQSNMYCKFYTTC